MSSVWAVLRRSAGVLTRADWTWSPIATDACQPLPRPSTSLQPGQAQQLWLQTRWRLRPGWYLFGIRHRGGSRQVVGWLRQGASPWQQGRPMYPVRRRWRVVRLRRGKRVLLNLQHIEEPLQLLELWMLRIPRWDALRRVRRRLSHSDQLASLGSASRSIPKLWRHYNRLLAAQARRHSLVSYEQWQRSVESAALVALPAMPASWAAAFEVRQFGDRTPVQPRQWAVLLAPGVELSAGCLPAIAHALQQVPDALLLYGDEDAICPNGQRHSPRFNPAWNRELCWCDPHYSSCWVVAAELWNALAPKCSLASWQHLVLGLTKHASTAVEAIWHLPMVLVHRHTESQPPLSAPAMEGLLQTLLATELAPQVLPAVGVPGYRLQWALPAQSMLSVVIPMRDRPELIQACVASIDRYPPGCELEIVVADNGSIQAESHAWLAQFQSNSSDRRKHIVVPAAGPFNYAAINNVAVQQSSGSVLLLLNNDVEFLESGWGRELASQALRPGIGCVGALLLHVDYTVQHGGVILGIGGIAAHSHQYRPVTEPGYQSRLHLPQELSAVTAACLAIQRQHWDALSGLDAELLAVNYNDVDLCLRARQLGLRNLYLPQVRAIHHESKSRGRPEGAAFWQWRREWAVMEARWGPLLQADPAYSPHLSLELQDWSLALRGPVMQPRCSAPGS